MPAGESFEPVIEPPRLKHAPAEIAQDMEKPCCKGAKPCQHWSYNGEAWVNSLSGRKKEVTA